MEDSNYRLQVNHNGEVLWKWASKELKTIVVARRDCFVRSDMGYGWESAFIKHNSKLAVRTLKHKAFLSDAAQLVRWCPVKLEDDNMAIGD